MKKLSSILCLLILVSCSIGDKDELTSFVETSNSHIDSVWMEQEDRITSGEWYKVLLVFGWIDDGIECERIVQQYKETYPEINYRCNPVK